MIERLTAQDFTNERFGAVIERAMSLSAPGLKFDPEYYFPFMWNGMSNEMVVAWSGRASLLVAMYYPHLFTGQMTGVVSLWAGRGSCDAIDLLGVFEMEARKRGCVSVHASSFGASRADTMARLYGRLGYAAEEVSFMKKINLEVK